MRLCSKKRPTTLLTVMFSDSPVRPGPEAADPSHHQTDLDARPGSPIQRVDDFAVHESVEFGPDGRRSAALSMFDFVVDELNQGIPKMEGSNDPTCPGPRARRTRL